MVESEPTRCGCLAWQSRAEVQAVVLAYETTAARLDAMGESEKAQDLMNVFLPAFLERGEVAPVWSAHMCLQGSGTALDSPSRSYPSSLPTPSPEEVPLSIAERVAAATSTSQGRRLAEELALAASKQQAEAPTSQKACDGDIEHAPQLASREKPLGSDQMTEKTGQPIEKEFSTMSEQAESVASPDSVSVPLVEVESSRAAEELNPHDSHAEAQVIVRDYAEEEPGEVIAHLRDGDTPADTALGKPGAAMPAEGTRVKSMRNTPTTNLVAEAASEVTRLTSADAARESGMMDASAVKEAVAQVTDKLLNAIEAVEVQ